MPEKRMPVVPDEAIEAAAKRMMLVSNAARDPANGHLSDPEEFVAPILKAAAPILYAAWKKQANVHDTDTGRLYEVADWIERRHPPRTARGAREAEYSLRDIANRLADWSQS